MKLALCAAMSLAVACGLAHAELTVWQVENNPPGVDSGSEWLTLVNTGENGTFDGYAIQTTNGRIAGHAVPAIHLDACEYHKITFARQAIDNGDDTVKLLKNGTTIYQTPVINDTGDDGRIWVNQDVAAVCDSPREGTEVGHEPLTEAEKDRRIRELEAENAELKAAISVLQ